MTKALMFFAIFAVAVQGETQFPHQLRSNTCRAVLIQNTQIQAWTSSGNSTRRHRRDALRCVVDMLTWSWHVDLKLTFWRVFYMLTRNCELSWSWHVDLKLTCWLEVDILTCILYVGYKMTFWAEVEMLICSCWHDTRKWVDVRSKKL